MSEQDIKDRIDFLRKVIDRENHRYYVLNDPEIDDREYDRLISELKKLEEEHPEFYDPSSPTLRVGSDITAGFEQRRHRYPMLSLSNTYGTDELLEFDANLTTYASSNSTAPPSLSHTRAAYSHRR